MAVVQISKIQIRRGQKNSSSGIPQLSSAEMAWAVDSQELFIGNGSVAEGAPYVGNTKVLTEHDNILELANSYTFASNDPAITLSQPRTLLGKIDEIEVSVADYGAVGDGSTDNVTAFQNALTDLFRNTDPNYKKVLKVPNGEYKFVADLAIPSNTIIKGETANGAVLNIDTSNIRFISATGTQLTGPFTSSDRPENIEISNITIRRSSGQVVITGMKNSRFVGVRFIGEYVLGQVVSSRATEPAAVFWSNDTVGIKVDNIEFDSCLFESNSISMRITQTVLTNTAIKIKNSRFFINDTSIYIIGVSGQGNDWNVQDCDFEEIATNAFASTNGYGTKIQRCNFKNCGNGILGAANPSSSIVSFGEYRNNVVVDCASDRYQAAGVTVSELTDAVVEVYNSDYTKLINRNYSEIFLKNSFSPVMVFSALNNFITINYVLRLGDLQNGFHVRLGKLSFVIGDDLSKLSFTDDYQFSDASLASEGGRILSNFSFDAQLADNDADSGIETIVLSYKNPLATGRTGNISFDIAYGV